MIVCDSCKCGDMFPDDKARRVRTVVISLEYDGEKPGAGQTSVRLEFQADRDCADQFASLLSRIVKENLTAPPVWMRGAPGQPPSNKEVMTLPRQTEQAPQPN